MAAEKSYARLGLFVVVGIVVILGTGLFFAQRMRSRAVISLVTYVAENVSGLDISSRTSESTRTASEKPSRSTSKYFRTGWSRLGRT